MPLLLPAEGPAIQRTRKLVRGAARGKEDTHRALEQALALAVAFRVNAVDGGSGMSPGQRGAGLILGRPLRPGLGGAAPGKDTVRCVVEQAPCMTLGT